MIGNLTAERGARASLTESALIFDNEGFLVDPVLWTEQIARYIAETRGIGPLRADHWKVVRYVRDRHLRFGAIPPMRRICRSSALSRKDIKALFGNCLEVWRIAGLPHPGEEAKAYMG